MAMGIGQNDRTGVVGTISRIFLDERVETTMASNADHVDNNINFLRIHVVDFRFSGSSQCNASIAQMLGFHMWAVYLNV